MKKSKNKKKENPTLGNVKSASTQPHVAASRRIPKTKQNTGEEGSTAQPNTGEDGSTAQPTTREDGSTAQPNTGEDGSTAQPNTITKDKCHLSKEDIKRKGPEADQRIVAKNASEPDNYGLWNIYSLTDKVEYLKELISVKCLGLMLLTETWLDGKNDDNLTRACPKGFKEIHANRLKKGGGGVAIIYSERYSVFRHTFEFISVFEYLALTIKQPNKTDLLIVIVYRPPNTTTNNSTKKLFHSEFGKMMSAIHPDNPNILIAGDFNFSKLTKPFMWHFDSRNFKQHVKYPTHKKGNRLDLIFSKGIEVIITANEFMGLSDHNFISFISNSPPAPTPGLED